MKQPVGGGGWSNQAARRRRRPVRGGGDRSEEEAAGRRAADLSPVESGRVRSDFCRGVRLPTGLTPMFPDERSVVGRLRFRAFFSHWRPGPVYLSWN